MPGPTSRTEPRCRYSCTGQWGPDPPPAPRLPSCREAGLSATYGALRQGRRDLLDVVHRVHVEGDQRLRDVPPGPGSEAVVVLGFRRRRHGRFVLGSEEGNNEALGKRFVGSSGGQGARRACLSELGK